MKRLLHILILVVSFITVFFLFNKMIGWAVNIGSRKYYYGSPVQFGFLWRVLFSAVFVVVTYIWNLQTINKLGSKKFSILIAFQAVDLILLFISLVAAVVYYNRNDALLSIEKVFNPFILVIIVALKHIVVLLVTGNFFVKNMNKSA